MERYELERDGEIKSLKQKQRFIENWVNNENKQQKYLWEHELGWLDLQIEIEMIKKENEAIRVERDVRFDILDPNFIEMLAKIAHYGAEKYGDFNWHASRLTGNKGPVNHMLKHINSYQKGEPYDHQELGKGSEWHLAAIAFNAMMEFYYVSAPKTNQSNQGNDRGFMPKMPKED